MEHFQEKWVNPKEKNENRKEKWAKSASKKEKKNRHKFEHNLPKPIGALSTDMHFLLYIMPPLKITQEVYTLFNNHFNV